MILISLLLSTLMAASTWPEVEGGLHDIRKCSVCIAEKQSYNSTLQIQVDTGCGLLHTRPCRFCGELLFSINGGSRTRHHHCVQESDGMCCGPKGKWYKNLHQYRTNIFENIPESFDHLWRQSTFSANARKLQQMNCFCSMGTETMTGGRGFEQFLPGGLTLSGRTYHQVRGDLEHSQNPLRWLLFDPADRLESANRLYGDSLDANLVEETAKAVDLHNRCDHVTDICASLTSS
jgi:hypothetical protein